MPRSELDPLPQELLTETPTVKLLYVWLARRGSVDLSQRQIASALGVTQSNVSIAIRRLRDLGLVDYPSRDQYRARVALSLRATREQP